MARIRYADVVATLALIIALGGTAFAAIKLGRNAVKTRHIAPNAVTSAKVKNRSLKAIDFKKGELSAGPKGDTGTPGPPGTQGAAGAIGAAGSQGAQGVQGAQGTQGVQGAQGTQGASGAGMLLGINAKSTATSLADGACHEVINVAVSVPATGTVIVRATTRVTAEHNAGAQDQADVLISTTTADCTPPNAATLARWDVASSLGNAVVATTLSASRTFSVTAGAQTFRLNAKMTQAASASDEVTAAQLEAIFYPS